MVDVQGPAKRPLPGCENAAGKLRLVNALEDANIGR